MGKTVMLNEFASIARRRGWLVIDESSLPGICVRIVRSLQDTNLQDIEVSPHTSVGLAPGGLGGLHGGTADALDLRTAMTRSLRALGKDRCILVLVDEVQSASTYELRHIATVLQQLMCEDQNVAFAFAGLPSAIDRFTKEPGLSLLRGAMPEVLNSLDRDDVRTSMRHMIEPSKMSIDATTLESLVDETACYPYMVQLVGYYAWQQAYRETGDKPGTIRREDLDVALPRARFVYDLNVIEPALGGLSLDSVLYFLDMSKGKGKVRESDIARRLNRSPGSLCSCREHLVREGLIVAPRRGFVDYSMPYVREYLRRHEEQLRSYYDAEGSGGE